MTAAKQTPKQVLDHMPCPKCGQPHPRCQAHRKSDGQPCTQRAMHGQAVCKVHGGMAKQNRAAAARRLAEAQASTAVRTLGLRVDVSPAEALLDEVQWTAGHVLWLRGKVQELGDELDFIESNLDGSDARGVSVHPAPARHELVWGRKQSTHKGSGQWPGTDKVDAAAPSVWYVLYTQERAHLVTVCTAALKAGVEERRVQLAEKQGELVAQVIRGVLDDLGLTPEQEERVGLVVPARLRLLAGGAL